jgi:hydrogenase maturation protein HypF
MARPSRRVRVGLRLAGLIQGVGLRPHVAGLAHRHQVGGWVRNDGGTVAIEAEGVADAVASFVMELIDTPPARARIDTFERFDLPARGERDFVVTTSTIGTTATATAPDAATCDQCLREIFEPTDRRHRYAFTSCLECGPRHTIVEAFPYDRERTSFAAFPMCEACREEHGDPSSRRFHAQTICCPSCGPELELRRPGPIARGDAAVTRAAALIRAGLIVALKSMGGFHLACRADDAAAVATLRERKRRPDKPLAVMARDLHAAEILAWLDDDTRSLLAGSDRPVVLVPRRAPSPLAGSVARDSPLIGLMLPATGLQHLLMHEVDSPLVMTSANLAGRPTAWRDGEGEDAADAVITHALPIAARCDDAVVRRVAGTTTFLRPARGSFPAVMRLQRPLRVATLAVGAELKNTICLGHGHRAVISAHLGDLGDYDAFAEMVATAARMERLEGTTACRIVHDLHPGYSSTRYAFDRAEEGLERLGVQHHHAHFAACLADCEHRGPAIGIVVDGTGYGLDGAIWGGEILVGDAARVRRAAHLAYVRMPGGSAAIVEPWRMALAHRMAAGLSPYEGRHLPDARAGAVAARLVETGALSPFCSSAGRLFDAVTAMLGEAPPRVTFDAQAAMRLEALAASAPDDTTELPFEQREAPEGPLEIDAAPAICAVDDQLRRGVAPATIARRFHEGLAAAFVGASVTIREREGLEVVALAGGVAANDVFVTALVRRLAGAGFSLLRPQRLPPNDAAIALGQISVALAADQEDD